MLCIGTPSSAPAPFGSLEGARSGFGAEATNGRRLGQYRFCGSAFYSRRTVQLLSPTLRTSEDGRTVEPRAVWFRQAASKTKHPSKKSSGAA
ncbi:hypothetical protein CBOM_07448 [Ceraceosorus bombacis]|uniref:Uncharacterized protein n=1 Tax=Ceraceosorus bombacis TaxID=401625 RepID=A0A0P1BE58_9BASI|nr:hypothetical protein CBOM_07448 [Ceraceosorus bombacis]